MTMAGFDKVVASYEDGHDRARRRYDGSCWRILVCAVFLKT